MTLLKLAIKNDGLGRDRFWGRRQREQDAENLLVVGEAMAQLRDDPSGAPSKTN
jgi:hypothetical protein